MNALPKRKRAARLAPETTRNSETTPEDSTTPATDCATDDDSGAVFRVLVRGPKRDKFWRSYPSQALAQAATARLRALGLDARVERIGDTEAP